MDTIHCEQVAGKLVVIGAAGQLGSQITALVGQLKKQLKWSLYAFGSDQLDITQKDAVMRALAAVNTSNDTDPSLSDPNNIGSSNNIDLNNTDPSTDTGQEAVPTVVVNCAAYTNVDGAQQNPGTAYAVNYRGAGYVAESCAELGMQCIHISTDYVFDGQAARPYEVTDLPCPQSVYGASKLAGEQAVMAALPGANIVRTAWLYTGDRQDFVATMLRFSREKEHWQVVDDQRGSPTYARDLAAGVVELAHRYFQAASFQVPSSQAAYAQTTYTQSDVGGQIFHLTNAGEASWFQLAQAVLELTDSDPQRITACTSQEFLRPAPRPHYSVLSNQSWIAAGLTPLRPWFDALSAALRLLWFK
jgi:dTDP-4-dehydrorhamnose reductase